MQSKQRRNDFDEIVGRNQRIYVASSATVSTKVMEPGEFNLFVTTTINNAITVTLPSVDAAVGGIYTIWFVLDGTTADCTIEDKDGDAGYADVVLTATADYLCVYSDGSHWIPLAEVST